MKHLQKFLILACFLSILGCSSGYEVERGFYDPDSPAGKAWLDEHTGNNENLGPNSPGYIGPEGEYSIYPENDEH